jgi:hypothetical protein
MTKEELKQRLIELVGRIVVPYFSRQIADYLVANGVTIRERGEWICKWKSTFPQYEPGQYCCSNCGCIKNMEYRFCPHCGADMRGDSK